MVGLKHGRKIAMVGKITLTSNIYDLPLPLFDTLC
jgi:hypothetical protein